MPSSASVAGSGTLPPLDPGVATKAVPLTTLEVELERSEAILTFGPLKVLKLHVMDGPPEMLPTPFAHGS